MPGGIDGSSTYIRQDDATQVRVFSTAVEFQGPVTGTAGAGVSKARGETPTGTIDGSNRSFTLAHTPTNDAAGRSTLAVYSDNIRIPPTEYTIVGTALAFVAGSVYIPATELLVDYDW